MTITKRQRVNVLATITLILHARYFKNVITIFISSTDISLQQYHRDVMSDANRGDACISRPPCTRESPREIS